MPKYNRTIRCVYITPADDTVSPLFSEKAVIVTVEDEAGGPFILINTVSGDSCKGEVRLDLEELEEVVEVAKMLINQETLKEAQASSREVAAPAPVAGGLVERVKLAIDSALYDEDDHQWNEGRAAILEVATWLRERGWEGIAALIELEAGR
jgi:hypothetical protein